MSSSITQTPTLKIALIGAGPASLTLAAILQNHSIPFTIYEASPSFRNQGGSLDLHPQAGQLALKEAGLWDEFAKHSRPESDVLKLVDISGEVTWDENTLEKKDVKEGSEFDGRPEIDRAALMQILYSNLAPASIKFGMKLQEVAPSKTAPENRDTYDLHFADGTIEQDFDLVVGGDGAWSRVRTLLSSVKPQYSGISAVEIWANDVASKPWLLNYVGAGSMFAFGEGCAVQSQRQGDGSVKSYASLRVPEDFVQTCGIDWSKPDEARKQYMERYFSHAGDDLKRVVLESTDFLVPRVLYELPVGFTWPHRSGVTLIGDSAHVMTPFAGVGVNVGMTDSLVLAKEIIASVNGEKSLNEALQAYEKEMWPRAAKFAEKTERNKQQHFRAGGARELAEKMREYHQ